MAILPWTGHQYHHNPRPREKLEQMGPSKLSDAELLAIFLRTGSQGHSAYELASALLASFGSLRAILLASSSALKRHRGIGDVTCGQIHVVLELSRRFYTEQIETQKVIASATDTKLFMLSQFHREKNEVFAVLLLNSQHQILHFKKMFFGTINAASVYPRAIVQLAIEVNAAAIILAHNHPSGVTEPSNADKHITLRITDALSLIDVNVLDHIIVGANDCVSFAERGII